jgi:hypothetical protein
MSSTQQLLLAEGGGGAAPNYIEDVFSTWLYTGTGAALTITNGIDLAGDGGLVWTKQRGQVQDHLLADTVRGNTKYLSSNITDAEGTSATRITSFDTTGYTLGTGAINGSTNTFASWTFRKQPKFFDVVTWTGNGAVRNISHSLGSVPGCIIVKCTTDTGGTNWLVYHRSLSNTEAMILNSTAAVYTGITAWDSTTPTSTVFTVAGEGSVNASGESYVAYLFAHDAGGFGLTGTDNVISCGSYTGNGSTSGPTITLGYEPQWLLIKRASGGTGDWFLFDNMRGLAAPPAEDAYLRANLSSIESNNLFVQPLATGFNIETSSVTLNGSGSGYIYIAIRRGPMKVPTDATKVFKPVTFNFDSFTTAGFPVDFLLSKQYDQTNDWRALDRLRGTNPPSLFPNSSAAESAEGLWYLDNNTGVRNYAGGTITNYENWMFQRAPTVMDVVCYTGTGSTRTLSHNLQAVPELMLIKKRSAAEVWCVYNATIGPTKSLSLNATSGASNGAGTARFNNTAPTSSVFTVAYDGEVNGSGATYVNYLFSTCAGVSKVGSYTGTGTTLQVDCGFAAGARFVLIKRTDSTGAWYVWDTARGIVSGNDPYLLLNSSAAEVTSTDYIDTYSAGFELSSTAPAALNASGGSYIFLAMA